MIGNLKTIFSYVLSGGLASLVLLLGLSLMYWQPTTGPLVIKKEEWPTRVALDPKRLTARAAIVYDVTSNRVLYAKNADESLPLASLTKLLAAQAVLAYESPSTQVPITAQSIAPEGDWGFGVGEWWSIGDLIRFSLAASSNDAIAAAAGSLGDNAVEIINNEARGLGLSTQILNPTGLDESADVAGGYGSARDVAILAAHFLKEHPTFFEATASESIRISHGDHTLEAASTAVPLLDMPGLIGAKTGYTDLAGGNLVAAFDLELGQPVIIAVLGSTRDGRFADVKELLEAVRKK